MRKIIGIMLAASLAVAATDSEKKARGIVFEYNVMAKKGSITESRTICYYKNGMYFTHSGHDYVVDVEPIRCKFSSELEPGEPGETLCLEYRGVSKAKRICECTPKGELQCHK